jgi:Ricin-type beta-trefoil lectin domain-like
LRNQTDESPEIPVRFSLQWDLQPGFNETYETFYDEIVNVNSGQCLTAHRTVGKPTYQWPCSGATNQQWNILEHHYEWVRPLPGLPHLVLRRERE